MLFFVLLCPCLRWVHYTHHIQRDIPALHISELHSLGTWRKPSWPPIFYSLPSRIPFSVGIAHPKRHERESARQTRTLEQICLRNKFKSVYSTSSSTHDMPRSSPRHFVPFFSKHARDILLLKHITLTNGVGCLMKQSTFACGPQPNLNINFHPLQPRPPSV